MLFQNLSPQDIRLPEEREVLSSLLVSADFCAAVEKNRGENHRYAQRVHYELLTNGLILTAQRAPELVALVESVKARLNLDCTIDVYVRRNDDHAAAVIKVNNDHYAVILSHWLLSDLNFDELAFVMGHELAHIAFNHFDILRIATEKLPSRLKEEVHEQNRLAEISADLAGAICCKDLSSPRKALYKLSCSGLADLLSLDTQTDQHQLDRVHELLEDQQTLFEACSSHPASIVRVTILSALEDFATGGVEERNLDKFHAAVKTLCAKSFPKTNKKEDWLTLIAAFWVAYADDDLSMEERIEVAKLCTGSEFKELSALCRDEEFPSVFLERYFREVVSGVKLTNPRRASLLQKVIHVSLADGLISAQEEAVLSQICTLIGLDQRFADHLISKYEEK
jgi:tellurite resistance protein